MFGKNFVRNIQLTQVFEYIHKNLYTEFYCSSGTTFPMLKSLLLKIFNICLTGPKYVIKITLTIILLWTDLLKIATFIMPVPQILAEI